MTKQLTPLRRKDQATGYAKAVKEIVAWLRADNGENYYECNLIAADIETKFGADNGQQNEI